MRTSTEKRKAPRALSSWAPEAAADALRDQGDLAAAVRAYRAALAIEPGRPTTRFGLAETLRRARDFAGAEAMLEGLRRDFPGAWQTHNDLGNVLRDQGRFEAAEAAYRAALALAETPAALGHLGALLRDMGRLDDALAVLDRALALEPAHAHARYTRAITLLTAGRWGQGFADFDARFAYFRDPPDPARHWRAGPPGRRTILVRAEQGLGDTLQFARYLPALAAAGARVLFAVQPPLARLFQGFPGAAAVLGCNEPVSAHAAHVRLMSLPQRLGIADLPPPAALRADPRPWQARLAALPGRKIGLAWAGSPAFEADHRRSLDPALLAPLTALPGITWVSLQQPPQPHGLPLVDWTAELRDFADTAALIAGLELVISVDTAVAHMAGTLGKPVWLLDRRGGCWRWGPGGTRTGWYPTMRLFRQGGADWEPVVAGVAAALRAGGPAPA